MIKHVQAQTKVMMEAMDARVHRVKEVVQGIRTVKAFGWEPRFEEVVQTARGEELEQVRFLALLEAANNVLMEITPLVCSLVVFALFSSYSGEDLTVSRAFVGLALFNMLRSIRFYKYYLHSKCFNLWRSNVRYKLYCQQRKKISHGLFLAKESFCAPLLELKTHMLELQQVKLLDLSSKSPFDCSVFVEVQQTKRQDAIKLFDSCMEKVAAVVQRVCSDVTSLARSADGGDSPLDLCAGMCYEVSG